MKRKVLAIFLTLTLAAGMTMTAYAEELPNNGIVDITDGASYDYSNEGSATSVSASNSSEVTVDSVSLSNVVNPGQTEDDVIAAVTGELATIHVNGDVTASGDKGIAGAYLIATDTDVHGNVTVTASDGAALGLAALGIERNRIPGSTVIVDGDVSVSGQNEVVGLNMLSGTSASKAYIKGNLTVEGTDNVKGAMVDMHSIVIIDGTVSVTATNGTAVAFNTTRADKTSGKVNIGYAYKVVNNSAAQNESIGGAGTSYIIKAQDGVNVSGTTPFSDEELGVSFNFAKAGTELIVSSTAGRIGEIRNAEAGVALQVRDNGNGTWSVWVPDGGGVNLQVIMAVIEDLLNDSSDLSEASKNLNIQTGDSESNKVTFAKAVMNAASLPVGTTVVVPGVGAISVSEKEINIVATGCGCFDKDMVNGLSNLTKDIVIIFNYGGRIYQFTIPADADLNQFLNEDGYAGYLYLSEMFGRYEMVDGKPVLVIPAKTPYYKKK